MTKKNFVIVVDNNTIKKDINLLLSFQEITGLDHERVAYKVSQVKYKPGIIQTVPVKWESTLAFSLASQGSDNVIQPSQIVKIDPLQQNVQIRVDEDGDLEFKNVSKSDHLQDNQISAENHSGREASVAVGFLRGSKFSPAAYIATFHHATTWIANYKPDLELYISSDGVTGQTMSSIALSPEAIHTWRLADPKDVPNNSYWVLSLDQNANFCIRREED